MGNGNRKAVNATESHEEFGVRGREREVGVIPHLFEIV